MNPLSPFKFIVNNKRKVLPTCFSISLGVFLIYFLTMIIGEAATSMESTFVKPLENYSVVVPAGDRLIPENILNEIKNSSDIEKIIPALGSPYGLSVTMIVSSTGTSVIFMDDKNIDTMLDKMNGKIIEGRKPLPGKQEILLHRRIAVNKGLKLGDRVGSEINPIDSLEGENTVVGIFDGPSLLSLASYPITTNMSEDTLIKHGFLIIPKPGRLESVNDMIGNFSMDDVFILSQREVAPNLEKRTRMLNLTIGMLEALVILVLCVSLGNISHINFIQRRREYGVLSAIGYSRGRLYKKIWLETGIISTSGYVLGIILSLTVGWLLNITLWEPKGQQMPLWNTTYVLLLLLIPFFVTIFSALPAVKIFRRTDPILVIEGVA